MRNMAAPHHGICPAVIRHQIGGKEFEPRIVDIDQFANCGLACKIADSGVHHPAFVY
jgi:hypothetical protein